MYVLIAGGGKVGSNLARTLIRAEHEVPEHGLVHLLELRKENLEIVEIMVGEKDMCNGKKLSQVALPEGSRLISVVRDGKAEMPHESMRLESGDSLLAILEPGKEDELRRVLVRDGA